MYHIPTAYLIIGLLYIFLPFVVWLVLKQQKSLTTLLWTLGGGLLAVGMLLIAVREIVPPWVSYPVANFFAWVGILMQAMALRRALQQTWRNEVLVVLVLFWLLNWLCWLLLRLLFTDVIIYHHQFVVQNLKRL